MTVEYGTTNITEVPWLGDEGGGLPVVMPEASFPTRAELDCYAPTELSIFATYDPAWNVGAWSRDFRGTVYVKIENTALVATTGGGLTSYIAEADGEGANSYDTTIHPDPSGLILEPGEIGVLELDLSPWLDDCARFKIQVFPGPASILGIQTTPFSAETFWTGVHGVTETTA